jgi:hypothetical protein
MNATWGRIGFTGSREGLSIAQEKMLNYILDHQKVEVVHHGSCVGADFAFHQMAREKGIEVVIHPPLNKQYMARCLGGSVLPAKPYLDRNRDIVHACSILVACPKEKDWKSKSGTWHTIRYAVGTGTTAFIIYRNGEIDITN